MIQKVTLRRFKRFREVTIDLQGNVVLAGPNNMGKTTVLQAIAAWSLSLSRWKELNDFQRHNGAYARAPIARQAFAAVPLRAFSLLWKDVAYSGSIEVEVQLASGPVVMELIADSTEQIYARPRKDVPPERVRQAAMDVVFVPPMSGLSVEEPVYQPAYVAHALGRARPGTCSATSSFPRETAERGNRSWTAFAVCLAIGSSRRTVPVPSSSPHTESAMVVRCSISAAQAAGSSRS